jgi:hypothetical protein
MLYSLPLWDLYYTIMDSFNKAMDSSYDGLHNIVGSVADNFINGNYGMIIGNLVNTANQLNGVSSINENDINEYDSKFNQ